jgi:predicted helicase
MVTGQDFLSKLYETTESPKDRGELFERFVAEFLRHDSYYGERFSNVWRWNDWPERGNEIDSGIDIVAREREGGQLWAIQVKYHKSKLQLDDIATFLALSGRKDFAKRMLVTSSSLGSIAERAMDGQEKQVVILTLSDILQSPIDWDNFEWRRPEEQFLKPKRTPYPFQKDAIDAVLNGFEHNDRGKLIMPPGSGKTFVALKIAEKLVGQEGYVLFLAPSIALVEQTIRAWLADTDLKIRPYAVTSDYTVGRDTDSIDRVTVLTIPPTTSPNELVHAAGKRDSDRMTVIVSTYHSIDVVSEAQKFGLPDFDLIIADEAHRTTGVIQGDDFSYYHKVHDNIIVKSSKRLYMTATPRIFVPRLRERLEERGFDYYTMDDTETYGEEFFRYGFGQGVDEGFLSDYKVVVFTVSEADVQHRLFDFLNEESSPVVEEATKIIGVWSVLSGRVENEEVPPLRRAVVFAGRISDSKSFTKKFKETADAYNRTDSSGDAFQHFDLKHIDGTMTATERKELLDWLRSETQLTETRILSNAKVLTEGIDVPALDAVVFLKPRRSVIDVVQAVGRAMRKAPGKRYGYVVLPIIVDPERDTAEQLDRNEEFRTVWEVLGALRSIDDRFDAMVRQLWIQRTRNRGEHHQDDDDILIISGIQETTFDYEDEILGKLVERVGDRIYLEMMAKDVAAVSKRLERHIADALEDTGEYGEKARNAFNGFLNALRQVINPSVTEEDARSMLVQHIITKPIFDATFGEYEFLGENPIANSFDRLSDVFETFVNRETQTLKNFYRLIQIRSKGLDKGAERQEFLRQLYDSFFKIAFPKMADRLGIVYTPVEVVDFLVKSVEVVLHNEFGLSLEDEGVVVLEPFAGTGTFPARLMRQLSPETLSRKYRDGEIWANEILLLPYYIALANIESTYFNCTGKHEQFRNLLLIDSFQLMEPSVETTLTPTLFPKQYTELMKKQKNAKIYVIISNPPWFAKQEDENQGIKAIRYMKLDEKIRQKYAAYSSAINKNSLYDSYIRAIRMATDRIGNRGVIAFVTNSGFLDGSAADGLRKSLAEEFAKIYVLNLRGNARLSGEAWRREGGKIFGQGSRTGVAVLILVKDTSKTSTAEIYYHDIGDYLSREEKLERLETYTDIRGAEWIRIIPNKAYDWINQRSEDFWTNPAIGEKNNKNGETIFNLYSNGLSSQRDFWVYNFSQAELEDNMGRMIKEFNRHVELANSGKITPDNIESKINNNSQEIAWCRELKNEIFKRKTYSFEGAGLMMSSIYRPFVKEWIYFSRKFNSMVYRLYDIFPEHGVDNIAITLNGPGNLKPFSVQIVRHIPDRHLIGDTQTFPLFAYEAIQKSAISDNDLGDNTIITAPSGARYIRRGNITDWALNEYRGRYGYHVTKEDIFYYVYGLLHSPEYRECYRNDLKKILPRIPYVATAESFMAFGHAGRMLADLHLNYENIETWQLEEHIIGDPSNPVIYKVEKMRFGKTNNGEDDKSVIVYNEYITLHGIPLEAYEYVVNGKSAIDWIVERYQVSIERKSGIASDPNKWLEEQDNPRYILDLIKSIVRLSMETLSIINSMPTFNKEIELRQVQKTSSQQTLNSTFTDRR